MQASYLLDVNVLIALFDPSHPHHEAAHSWFAAHQMDGWATCPVTQNGCVRVLSSTGYPGRVSVSQAVAMVRELCAAPTHSFWPVSPALVESAIFRAEAIPGAKQITDVHLLATAIGHAAKLVTFDRSIAWQSVIGAKAGDLVLPGS
jgi:uncharacterized protein